LLPVSLHDAQLVHDGAQPVQQMTRRLST
jgi:hypothetical protein